MVKGETGTLSLDVRTSVDKGVSTFFTKGNILTIRSEITFPSLSSFKVLFSVLVLFKFCSLLYFLILLVLLCFFAQAVYCSLCYHYYFYKLCCSFFLSQRRAMFLKNDYFYTILNETPFRFV